MEKDTDETKGIVAISYETVDKPGRDTIEAAVVATLEMEEKQGKDIDIRIVSSPAIKQLNNFYRRINQETDVLSFPSEEIGELGVVFICLEVAAKQANDLGHSLLREMAFLAIHGTLHLLGYDHISQADEVIMFAKQRAIIREWELDT